MHAQPDTTGKNLNPIDLEGKIAAFILFVAFFFTPSNGLRVAANVAFSDVAYVLAGVLAVRAAVFKPQVTGIPLGFVVALLLFIFSGLSSALVLGEQVSADLLNLGRFLISAFALPLVIGWSLGHSQTAIRIAITGWVLGATFSALYAILNRFGMWPLGAFNYGTYWTGRYSGLTLHPNMLGLFSCFAAVILFFVVILKEHRPFLRLLALLALAINAYAIDLSGSRAAAGSLAVGLLFSLMVLPGKAQNKFRILAGAGLMALVFLSANFMLACEPDTRAQGKCVESVWVRIFSDTASTERSDFIRAEKLSSGWQNFLSSPLIGNGYSAVRTAHNIYLQLLESGGLVSFLGFLIYLTSIARLYYFNTRSQPQSETGFWLSHACAACLIVWLANGLFQNLTIERNNYIAIGLLLALFYTNSTTLDRNSQPRSRSRLNPSPNDLPANLQTSAHHH